MQHRHANPGTLRALLIALILLAPIASFADDPKLETPAQQEAPTAFAAEKPKPVLNWGAGDGKSYLIPALDILVEEFLLNQYDRHVIDSEVYGSNFSTAKHNLTHQWVVDSDKFKINQFLHPYQGSIYQNAARSAGLDFWESMGYSLLGSALWEIAGETDPASINDEFTTGIGGAFLGEPLFRMSSLLLESGNGKPGFWREVGAAFISPATGFNRLAYGDRFDGVFRSHDPAVYTRVQLGANLNQNVHSNVNLNTVPGGDAIAQTYHHNEASADFTMAYGLPGKEGYTYDRPFDYFHFQFTATTQNAFENIISRGLLYGTTYSGGDNYRGIWGLYGTYDYIAPQLFRVSTTGAGVGTTGQWWISKLVAVQGTALASVGYGSSGVIRGTGDRDYHNGITPQALLTSRFIFGDRASIDLEARNYYVSRLASGKTGGSENIVRADIALTFRVYNLHGITIKYAWTARDAEYSNLAPKTHQSVGAIGISYSYLGQTRFGAVDWRPPSEGGPP
jgi:hypothetical protein